MKDWRLIALDMDGTLLHSDGTMTEENRKWIRKAMEAGIQVTIATGRQKNGVVETYVRELGISTPFVTVNGGEVWRNNEDIIERHPLETKDVSSMHNMALEHGCQFWASTTETVFHVDDFPAEVEEHTWLKFGFFTEHPSVVKTIWETLDQMGRFELTNSHPANIEVNPKGISKASGLAKVCQVLGIGPQQVITMGDSLNDVSMLTWSGLGIAMGNAQEDVKRVASRVTDHHAENGVARAIERILASEY